MSAIGPGDWIECVDARGEGGGPLSDGGFLVEGRVYCVESLSRAETAHQLVDSVRLVGQPDRHALSGRKGSYGLFRFKPVYRPDETLATRLMEPLPDALAPTLPERVSEPETA